MLTSDLDELLDVAGDDLRCFADSRILITGGTGFLGTWLLASIAHANRRLGTRIAPMVITRDPERARTRLAALTEGTELSYIRADLTESNAAAPTALDAITCDAIIHAGASTDAHLNANRPEASFAQNVTSTQRVIDIAERQGAIPLLFFSTGAVLGPSPQSGRLAESDLGGPDTLEPLSAYAESKRVGELFCAMAHRRFGLQAKIARIFSFVGPHLPRNRHYAVGQFLDAALRGEPIRINGDGTTIRTFLYAGDGLAWLWGIFARGASARAYHIGSDLPLTMKEVAERIAAAFTPAPPIEILGRHAPALATDRYIPDTTRSRQELGLRLRVDFDEAIRRTITEARQAD